MNETDVEAETPKRIRYDPIEQVARAEARAADRRTKLLEEVRARLDSATKSLTRLREIAAGAGDKKVAKSAERALNLLAPKAQGGE